MKKIVLWFLVVLVASIAGFAFWYNNINHVFRVISEEKVYKSGLIPPEDLDDFLIPNKVKTVVNLLDPGVQDALNPAKQTEIDAEEKAIAAINKKYGKTIRHINIPSPQVPTKKTLKAFYDVIDDPANYPIQIHCYHGMGRAVIYSAIYRIEKEGWSNEAAQQETRLFSLMVDSPLHHSSFAKGRSKGDFLLSYRPRSEGNNSTYAKMKE